MQWPCQCCRSSLSSGTQSNADMGGDASPMDDVHPAHSMPELMGSFKWGIKLLRDDVFMDFERKSQTFDYFFKTTEVLKAENVVIKMVLRCTFVNVEIQEIPDFRHLYVCIHENLILIVNTFANMLNYKFEASMIDSYLNPMMGTLSTARVDRRNLGHNHGFRVEGVYSRFYINEHKSLQTKLLLEQAQEKVKTRG
ncbi:hypothetical protein WA026_012965 [Henosepilachna vigintioctopunctata]|uniref:Uncharacterized protein n=1 Tax=Henosepilachna vigintioctopunctata TaxID=420089 RepID=A0AAW1TT94_9CUCU